MEDRWVQGGVEDVVRNTVGKKRGKQEEEEAS